LQQYNRTLNDLNKVFIPCRIVLEMEALISLYLIDHTYDTIKELYKSRPSSKEMIDIMGFSDFPSFINIIEYFVEVAVPKVKPIVTYSRKNFERIRSGNIIPYTKTRVYGYLSLHQLKLKLLMINHIVERLKNEKLYDAQFFKEHNTGQIDFYFFLFAKQFYEKYEKNLSILFPKSKASDRVKNLRLSNNTMTVDKLLKMMTSQIFLDKPNFIKFIMREIKASLFVSKFIFFQMDLSDPFSTSEEMINAEEIMVSNDFIPELIPAICTNLSLGNTEQYEDCRNAFDFLLEKVLEGINKSIERASRNQIKLGLYDSIYYNGDILSD